jgi:hypothetical protein
MTNSRQRAARAFPIIVLLTLVAWVSPAQGSTEKCAPVYQNHNMVDYGPLAFRRLSGYDVDPYSVRMVGGCIALFTEGDHRLVAITEADQDGKFAFGKIPTGRYRLVVDFRGFCVANVPLRIVRWPHAERRKLVLHMALGAIDTCSHGDYK